MQHDAINIYLSQTCSYLPVIWMVSCVFEYGNVRKCLPHFVTGIIWSVATIVQYLSLSLPFDLLSLYMYPQSLCSLKKTATGLDDFICSPVTSPLTSRYSVWKEFSDVYKVSLCWYVVFKNEIWMLVSNPSKGISISVWSV